MISFPRLAPASLELMSTIPYGFGLIDSYGGGVLDYRAFGERPLPFLLEDIISPPFPFL